MQNLKNYGRRMFAATVNHIYRTTKIFLYTIYELDS